MLSLFIGSSSEAKSRGIVPKLVALLGETFTVRPWYDVFDQGLFTLEALLLVRDQVDLAILVFANDDERESRGQVNIVTRDNVVLEYGLFLATLGRSRVWVLKEEGVVLPTDLSGLSYRTFRSRRDEQGHDPILDAELQLHSQEIRTQWRNRTPLSRTHTLNDSGIGVAKTLSGVSEKAVAVENALMAFVERKSRSVTPFTFDSREACFSTYAEALELVRQRFWTTTYMFSGFWTQGDAEILHANTRMMARMRENQGDVKRIFLLDQPILKSVQSWKENYAHLRGQGEARAMQIFRSEFLNLRRSFEALLASGCQIRVVHDVMEYGRLPRQIDYSVGASELAIYDDFRVDIFEGRAGIISSVKIFSRATRVFDGILQGAEDYFKAIWDHGESGESYLDRLEDAYAAAEKRIDYAPNWLAMYEFALDPHDEDLKTVEIKRVEEILRKLGRWGNIGRYLDVGTCTARYPLKLREGVREDGEIFGIDDDSDAVRFSDAQRREKAGDDLRIRILQVDFGARELPEIGKFDLVTCMLGTLSHFGWDRKGDFNDLLQMVLVRMADLLTKDGILILGIWSRHAREQADMLSIYRESDLQRLQEWTPNLTELKQRIGVVGLEIIEEGQPDVRLDVLACRRGSSRIIGG